ncbi:PASTA domain-containing protein [Streptomyces sp. NPDC001455]|uniref:PASTA domain-containing protein n=1 Tax=unclassified Streptomyces TaxID=2593676 RepID=UPI003320A7EA
MRTRTATAALVGLATVTLLGCDPGTTAPQQTDTPPPTAAASHTAPAEQDDKPVERKEVPDFVGMGLQSAQDKAQAEGFYVLKSHDSAGRGRMQALDHNWKVCSQNPAPGKTVPVDTALDFGAVKLEETCPSTDQQEPAPAGKSMPDFVGKSVKAARGALDSSTSLTVKDAARDRMVLMESNWKVCTQDPKAGAALNGQPVEFTAVKFDESCP